MNSNIINYFKRKQLDGLPGIEAARKVRNVSELTTVAFKSSMVEDSNEDTKAFRTVPSYIHGDVNQTLLFPDANLIKITDFYFNLIETWFGSKPFEGFILNKSYREHCDCSMHRTEFLKKVSTFLPFLNELIVDTCNFIITGQRDIHVRVLHELSNSYNVSIRNNRNPIFPVLNVQRRFEWKDIENMSSQEFFSAWVGRKHGIQDLICSYKIMLGL